LKQKFFFFLKYLEEFQQANQNKTKQNKTKNKTRIIVQSVLKKIFKKKLVKISHWQSHDVGEMKIF
jgi:hypothetical protein